MRATTLDSRPTDLSRLSPLFFSNSASYDNTTKVWDAKKGTCVYTLVGHNMPVYSVEFSHDGHYLASGSYDHMLLVWSMEVCVVRRRRLRAGGAALRPAVAVCPSPHLAAACSAAPFLLCRPAAWCSPTRARAASSMWDGTSRTPRWQRATSTARWPWSNSSPHRSRPIPYLCCSSSSCVQL